MSIQAFFVRNVGYTIEHAIYKCLIVQRCVPNWPSNLNDIHKIFNNNSYNNRNSTYNYMQSAVAMLTQIRNHRSDCGNKFQTIARLLLLHQGCNVNDSHPVHMYTMDNLLKKTADLTIILDFDTS